MLDRLSQLLSKLAFSRARQAAKPFRQNEETRREWVKNRLAEVPAGHTILDVGAGECQYKPFCAHLNYTAQDVNQYDGKGDGVGLQTKAWDFSRIDLVCDIYEIPTTTLYDAVLCTEVLEHIVDAPRALELFGKLVKPDGVLILTAPFACLTHFAPHFYSSGYSEYFYKTLLERHGFALERLEKNGSYFRQVHYEVVRLAGMADQYTGEAVALADRKALYDAAEAIRRLIEQEERGLAEGQEPPSASLSSYGLHVVARKR
jgi:SAM-dependent methyltransferase